MLDDALIGPSVTLNDINGIKLFIFDSPWLKK
jgi:hypothetical protein